MRKKIYLEEKRGIAPRVFETLTEIAVIAVIALFIAQFLFYSVKTESRSMEPTVMPSSVVFTDRVVYKLREPARFDVVAFRRTDEDNSDILVRRIVGLPGESIRISGGTVYINGNALDVSDYFSEITSDGIAGETITLGENEYFVLGDMPANSEDSRSSTIGTVNRDRILGKTWLGAQSVTQLYLIR